MGPETISETFAPSFSLPARPSPISELPCHHSKQLLDISLSRDWPLLLKDDRRLLFIAAI
jgi:hypothetical protein